MKQKLKKVSLFLVISLVMFFIVIANNTNILRPMSYDTIYEAEENTVGEILEGDVVTQSFVCNSDNLSKFDLIFYSYERENTCSINVELYNKTQNRSIEKWNLNGETIPHCSYFTFTLNNMEENVLGNEYEIRIKSEDAVHGNAFSLYCASDNIYENGECQVNGKSSGKDLCFTLFYPGTINFLDIHTVVNLINIYIILTIMIFIVCFVFYKINRIWKNREQIAIYLKKNKKNILQFLALVVADIIIGIVLELLISFIIEHQVNSLGKYFNSFRFCYITCIMLVAEEILFYAKKKIETIESLFVYVMLTIGCMLILTQPIVAAVNWDGQIHYDRTVSMAYLTEVDYTKADNDMSLISYDFSDNMLVMKKNYASSAEYADKVFMKKSKQYTISYTSFSYIPAAMAYRVGRLVHAPFWFTFSLGRMTNLALYTYLLYKAVKKLKWGKMICAIIGLFPTSLFLATNYGYDHWVTVFSILGIAYIIGEMQDTKNKISWKSICIIFGSFFFGYSAKAIYFPMVVLCFMMKKEKFSSKKMCYVFKVCSLALSLLVASSFMIPFLTAGPGTGDARGGSEVNSTEQVKFILTQPWEYTKILLRFLFVEYLNPIYSSGYTNAMAYLGTGSFGVLSFLALILSIFIGRNKEEKDILTVPNRIWAIVLVFGTVCLVATALYVSFTPVAYNTVNGCQYRYIIPILFPLLYFFDYYKISEWISKKISIRNSNVILTFLSVLALFLTYYQIWIGKLY